MVISRRLETAITVSSNYVVRTAYRIITITLKCNNVIRNKNYTITIEWKINLVQDYQSYLIAAPGLFALFEILLTLFSDQLLLVALKPLNIL